MYVPSAFQADDDFIARLVAMHPLAHVVVHTSDGLVGTPVPLVVRAGSLVGHVARGNSLWRHGGEALALFSGADAYVSPAWYPS